MGENLKRRIKLENRAKERFEECVNKGKNKEKCFEEAVNWLKGIAKFQGVEIRNEKIENLRVKWLKEE